MRKVLLIVDDEPSIGLILKHYFSKEYEVVVKHNGYEAISWLQKGNLVDGVIADLEMPQMNGLDFILQLRASIFYKDIPLLMLSGIDQTSTKILCLKSGADDYIIKPFNPEELEVRLQNVLKRVKI